MKYAVISLFAFMIVLSGCGVNSSTPEEAYKSCIESKADNKIDNVIELISSKSYTEQGIDIGNLKNELQKNLNDLKAANYKLENINITSTEKLDENTAIVIADIRYRTSDKQEVQVSKGDMAVFLKEKDGWRLSPNNYVKTINIGHKCGASNGVEICLDKMLYYADEVYLQGSVENKTDRNFSFGFSSLSPMELKFSDGYVLRGNYPRLGASMDANIGTGKRNVNFAFGEAGKYYLLKSEPVSFSIGQIIPMNGSLPSNFGNDSFAVGVSIK
jgi:hypothetical protein